MPLLSLDVMNLIVFSDTFHVTKRQLLTLNLYVDCEINCNLV